jgi:organic radical activating enzyme
MEINFYAIQVTSTWQGEGVDTGKRVLMIRFKRCNRVDFNYPCPFCDTKVLASNSIESSYSIEQMQEIIKIHNIGLLITGGEPTYGINLDYTNNILKNLEFPFADIETNGYDLEKLIDNNKDSDKEIHYIFSPKIFNKDDLEFNKKLTLKIKDNKNVFIKLVYLPSKLILKYLSFLKDINFDNNRIYLMPEGKTRDELLKNSEEVFDMAEKYNCNFSSRDHIIYNFI